MTTQNTFSEITKFLSCSMTNEIADQILNIQFENSFSNLNDSSNGFLFTVWSKAEFLELLEKGAELYVVFDEDRKVSAYALITSIRILEKAYSESENKNESVFFDKDSKYLYQIAVLRGLARRGLGKKILTHIEKVYQGKALFLDIMCKPLLNHASHIFFTSNGFAEFSQMEHSDYRGLGRCKWLILKKSL